MGVFRDPPTQPHQVELSCGHGLIKQYNPDEIARLHNMDKVRASRGKVIIPSIAKCTTCDEYRKIESVRIIDEVSK